MTSHGLILKYRSIRIGLCVEAGNIESLHRTALSANCLWGGVLNSIIPVSNASSELSNQLVLNAKADILLACDNSEAVSNFVASFSKLNWNASRAAQLGALFFPGNRFLDIRQPLTTIASNKLSKIEIVDFEEDDPMRVPLIMMLGNYPDASFFNFNYRELVKSSGAEVISLKLTQEIPQDILSKVTPSKISVFGIQGEQGNLFSSKGFYIGNSHDFDDLVAFWNLRASGQDLIFIDPSHKARLQELIANINTNATNSGVPYSVYRRSHTSIDSDLVGNQKIINSLSEIKAQTCFISEHSVLASNIEKTVSIPLLNKSYPRRNSQHLMVSISPFEPPDAEGDMTFFPPNDSNLNEYLSKSSKPDKNFTSRTVRIEPRGFAVVIDSDDDHLQIPEIDAKDYIRELFSIYGLRLKASNPGLVATRVLEQLGGLVECRVFKIEGVRKLINLFMPDEHFSRSKAELTIRDESNGVIGIDRFNHFKFLPKERACTAQNVFEHLVSCNVFRIGVIIQCSECLLSFWISIDELRNHLNCDYCSHNLNVATQLQDRNWAFRKSGLFARDDKQQGSVTVLLVLEQLLRLLINQSPLFAMAHELILTNDNGKKCETDFIVLTKDERGKNTIIISECKTSQPISEADLSNLRQVAACFPADKFDCFIVFAKLADYSDEEIELFSKDRDSLILLSKSELEAECISVLPDASIIDGAFLSLNKLVEYTQMKYLNLSETNK